MVNFERKVVVNISGKCRLYNNIIFHHIINLLDEIRAANSITIEKYNSSTHGKKRKNKKPTLPKDWAADLQNQFNKNRDRTNRLEKSLSKNLPINGIERYLVIRTIKCISSRYRKKLEKILVDNRRQPSKS